jgi:diamine N-acetyltransferase
MSSIILRAIEPEDLDVLYRIENDASLWDVGVTNVPYSRFFLHEYVAGMTGDIYKDGQVRLIIENSEGIVVGIADLLNFDASNRKAEIGIVIEAPFRGNGYAIEAIRQIVEYAHRKLHLHQLYAIVSSENSASQALFSKAGFLSTANLIDWLYDGTRYHSAIIMQLVLNH